MVKVTFIGSGNVATHLAKAFFSKGVQVAQVFSPNLMHANELANEVNAEAINELNDIDVDEVSLIIIAIKDDEIKTISKKMNSLNIPVVHTSGTVSMNAVSNNSLHGVFYPLQTFSKEKKMDISNVPFCIEASSKPVRNLLIDLASVISNDVRNIDSETRKSLHVAAVFACNFSNHMLAIADELLSESGQDISILNPLVQETIQKALSAKPADVQTGPAVRKDSAVIESHIMRLEGKPSVQNIYKDITQSIINWKNE